MNTKLFNFLIFLSTAVNAINFLLVVNFINPDIAGPVEFAFFYLSLTLVLIGLLYLSGSLMRRLFKRYQPSFLRLQTSWRQSIWFTILILSLFMLYQKELLNFLNVILLLVILTILEFLFISFKKEI
ncbi:hypothetical protein C4569_01520 [Candidatus Parcubacteria bacterium]|nr:MAG: hypothetical protein C4569_01520 [Candidatus Parcubacteria bacterium]